MDKDDLIDIDESKLPNVNLTVKQKERIRREMIFSLTRFRENNHELPIDTSPENIKAIEDALGDSKNHVIHGVKNARVLKALALQAANKDCPIKKEALICDKFFLIGTGMEAKDAVVSYLYSVFYCQVFLSKDMMVTYSFDNYFRLQYKRVIPIKDIRSVGITNITKDKMKLSRDNLLIDICSSSKSGVSTYYLVNANIKESSDIHELRQILFSLGIPPYKPRITLGLIFRYIYYLPWILLVLYLILIFIQNSL